MRKKHTRTGPCLHHGRGLLPIFLMGILLELSPRPSLAERSANTAWLGLQLVSVEGAVDQQTVRAIRIGGPAHKAGLKTDDLVIEIDGAAADAERLGRVLRVAVPGQVIQFSILRKGHAHLIKVVAETAPPAMPPPPKVRKRKGWLGIGLKAATDEEQERLGLERPVPKVTRVFRGSPAEMSGFKVDDFVLEFNDVPIKSVSDLVGKVGAIEPGAQAKIICHSGTKTVHRNVVLDLRPDMRELFVSEWRGRPMPNVDVLRARDQKRVELSGAQRKGTILVIDYFATWCGPCKRIMPDLSELQKSYEGQGVQVIGVSGEDRETVEQYRLKYTPDYQLAVDDTGVFRRELNVSVLPTIWIVDRRGIIQDIWFGAGHMSKVRDSLKKLLEAPVKE